MATPRTDDRALLGFRSALLSMVRSEQFADLSARQLGVLLVVGTTAAPHTIRGLAAELEVAKPAMTRAVDRLEELGLACRKPDPSDGRSVLVEPTRTGRALLRDFVKAMA